MVDVRLKNQQWETKDGQKRNALRVVAEDFQFIGGKAKKGEGPSLPEGVEPNDVNEEEIPF